MNAISRRALLAALLALFLPAAALAEVDSGDTAWILTSTALVLFMTIPGLALFYAGLVRAKNVLSVLMHCFALTAMITLLWLVFGYSLAFDATGMMEGKTSLASFVGGFDSLRSHLQKGTGRGPGVGAHDPITRIRSLSKSRIAP